MATPRTVDGLPVNTTSVSLLRRLGEPRNEAAWGRFVELYAPLLYRWGRGRGLSEADAAEVVQDVLAVLVVKLRDFRLDPNLRFRGWLRTVAVNRANDRHRHNALQPVTGHGETIDHVAEAEHDPFEEAEYRRYVVNRALQLARTDFSAQTWQACWAHAAEGRSAAEVGAELGMTANAVRVAKSRVLRRLREELTGLLD